MSDGIVEAHSKSGELYGFERLRALTLKPAREIAALPRPLARTTTSPCSLWHARPKSPSNDGGMEMALPKNFAAEFDIRTRDGGLTSNLPLMVEGTHSGRDFDVKMNGGGALLMIHTSDGGVTLSTAGKRLCGLKAGLTKSSCG